MRRQRADCADRTDRAGTDRTPRRAEHGDRARGEARTGMARPERGPREHAPRHVAHRRRERGEAAGRVDAAAERHVRGDADRDERGRLHGGHAVERLRDRSQQRPAPVAQGLRPRQHGAERRERRGRARLQRHAVQRGRARRQDGQTAVEHETHVPRRADRDDAGVQGRRRLRLDEPARRRGHRHAVGARRAQRAQTVELGGVLAQPVGQPGRQRLRRAVASARVRRRRRAVHLDCGPLSLAGHRQTAVGQKPARTDGATRSSSWTPAPADSSGADSRCRTTSTTGTSSAR